MSGVFGIVDSKYRDGSKEILSKMASAMTYREWFNSDMYADPESGVYLGRLNIGVFNGENQPLWSENKDLLVFLTGELYETEKLRSDLILKGYEFRDESDLELVLHLYQDRGKEFVAEVEGVFLILIWDIENHELIIANDRYGLYPLYYSHQNNRLIFSPEVKPLLNFAIAQKKINYVALAEYMRFQFLLGDKTFFEDIELFPNATVLTYNVPRDKLSISSYWDFTKFPSLPPNISFEDSVEEASFLLDSGIKKLTSGNQKIGAYLSGGLDSRVIIGMMSQHLNPITTISYGIRDCRDVIYSRKVSDELNTNHYYYELSDGKWVIDYVDLHLDLTEGFHSWIHSQGISILDQVRGLVDVNLTGLHGAEINWDDEILYSAKDDIAFFSRLFYLLNQQTTWKSLDSTEEKFLYSPELSNQMQNLAHESLISELEKYKHWSNELKAGYFSFSVDRRLYQYYTVFHRAFIEQRYPFYDYRYFEFIHSIPPSYLFDRKLRRAVIRKLNPNLARIPYDKDNLPITQGFSRYGSKLIEKSKTNINRYVGKIFPEFTTLNADYETWLRNDLIQWGKDIILGEESLNRGIFNPDFLKSIWQRQISGLEVNMIGKVAPIMTFEMLMRKFSDS